MKLIRFWLRCFAQGGIVAGPIFGVLAVGLAWRTASFIRHAEEADAIITILTKNGSPDGNVTYSPIFTFITPSGETITKSSATGTNPPSFAVGEHVKVLFSPDNPGNAEIDSTGKLWGWPIGSAA